MDVGAAALEQLAAEPWSSVSSPVAAPSPVPTPPDGGPFGEQLDLFPMAPAAIATRPTLRLIKGGKASAVEVEVDDAAPDTVRGMDWGLWEGGAEGVG